MKKGALQYFFAALLGLFVYGPKKAHSFHTPAKSITAVSYTLGLYHSPKPTVRGCECPKKKKQSLQKRFQSSSGETSSSVDKEPSILGFPRDTVATPLALLLLSQFILFIGVGAVIPSIPLYGKEIGLSQAANGVVISAPAVALLLGAKFGGNYADVARKPAMLLGMAGIAVSDVGTALASGLVPLVAARLGLGAGRCLAEAGERGMLADLAGRVPSLRGRALAAQQAMVALGIAIGAPLGGVVVEEYGPRAAFLCVSAAAFTALLLYTLLPETASGATKMEGEGMGEDKLEQEELDWEQLLVQDQWKGLALCQVGASFGFAAKIASIPIHATEVLPGGAAGAGALLSLAGLSGLVGAPAGGWLTDRVGAIPTAVLSGSISAAGLMLIPVALGLAGQDTAADSSLLLGLSPAAAGFSAAVLAWSAGAAAQGPALTAAAQAAAPPGKEATALALPRAAGDGTYVAAPFLLGLVADRGGAAAAGLECAAAGAATALGALALALLAAAPATDGGGGGGGGGGRGGKEGGSGEKDGLL